MHLNKLITFDMSFSYNMIKERNLKAALFSRNLDGYFSKVISVHPLAGLFNDSTEKYGSPDIHYVSDDHIFIEGKIGWSSWLKWIFPINFLIAQVVMIFQLIRLCKKKIFL